MMRNQKRILAGIAIVAICGLFSGCNNGADDPFDYGAQLEKEIKQIDDYLSANGLTAVADPSGIRMVISKLGTGLPAQRISTVDIDYKGTLLADGSTFGEANTRETLNGYIPGWQIAFAKLPEGSEATLFIPSYYGYENVDKDKIPANSTLVFDVKFKDVIQSSSHLQKLAADTVAIDDYLEDKAITALNSSGIRYVITTPGNGPFIGYYDKLKIKFSFKLLSNDQSTLATYEREPDAGFYSRAVDYNIMGLHGMMIGLFKMNEGAKATLYVPSGMAFGPDGYRDDKMTVPVNTNLIIEVEVLDVL
jgi:FKBP-type peptidyl-prolyl cis-trans isomerase FkpA